MRKTVLLSVFLLVVCASCSNDLQVALPGLLTTMAPLADPEPGLYSHDLDQIILISSTPGAVIYYTSDTTAPTVESQVYEIPFSLSGHGSELYIRAIALKDGKRLSGEFTGIYFLEYSGPITPELLLVEGGVPAELDGVYQNDLSLSIADPPTENLYPDPPEKWSTTDLRYCYTLDGSIPVIDTDSSSPTAGLPIYMNSQGEKIQNSNFTGVYDLPGNQAHPDLIEVTASSGVVFTLRSYVVGPLALPMSSPLTYSFAVSYQNSVTAIVVFEDEEGNRNNPFDLSLSVSGTAPAGHSMEYKIAGISNGIPFRTDYTTYDPLNPPEIFGSELWSSLKSLDTAVVTARVVCPQYQPGTANSGSFTYYLGVPNPPTAMASAGTTIYDSGAIIPAEDLSSLRISLMSDEGSTIYYSLDGLEPSTSSLEYLGEIPFTPMAGTNTMVLHAMANRGGPTGVNSPVKSLWFTSE